MNVAISTFARQGYLLTALAVAVLVFASSGTAWAQTKVTATSRFSGSSGALPEGADLDDLSKPRPLKVTVTRTTRARNDPYNNPPSGSDAHLILQFEHNGARGLPDGITVKADDATSPLDLTNGAANLTFGSSGKTRSESTTVRITSGEEHPEKVQEVNIANTQIVLTFEDGRDDDGDWLPETFSMTVGKHPNLGNATEFTDNGTAADSGTSTVDRLAATRNPYVNDFTSSKFTVTIADDDPMPKFRFSSRDIQLAKENVQRVTASVGVGAGGASPVPGESDDAEADSIGGKLKSLDDAGSHDVVLTVEPPDAVGRLINIRDGDSNVLHPDAMDRYVVGQISEAVPTTTSEGIVFEIEAKAVPGFRDEQVAVMLMDGRTAERMAADGGGIDDADPAMVTVLSGEETPSVSFSKSSISINEGAKDTVHLLADGDQGNQVGSATVSVSGDALISLRQNGSSISGGTVSFDGSANAELEIVSLMDRELEDGEEKTATVTITDASGASIGDPRALTVTVVGATAVPALPLIGQLLLALFLMAGGSRLYRRRQK